MRKTNLKLRQKVTWMRMRDLVPRAGKQQGSSIRPGMPGFPVSSGNLWFLLVGKGPVLPRASPGEQQDAVRGCPVGMGQEVLPWGVMERAVEVTRGADDGDPWVGEGTWVLWRGNFGGETVVKDLLW